MTKPITSLLWGIFMLFAATMGAQQPTFSLIPATINKNVGDTVNVAVKVSNFQSIFSMQYGIQYRNTVLKLDTILFPNPLALTNGNLDASVVVKASVGGTGFVNTSWVDNTFDGQTLPNGTTLYTLRFKVLTASADTIKFGKTSNGLNIEVGSAITGGNVGMNGVPSIKVGTTPPPPPLSGWALLTDPVSGAQGDVVTIPVKVQDFTKITSMQWYHFWDKTKLEFQGVQDINLTDLSNGSFIPGPISTPANITQAQTLGRLGLSWFDNSPTLTGVTVANGTAIYKLKFKILAAAGTTTQLTFGPLPPNFPAEVANQTTALTYQAQNCTVTVTAAPPPVNAPTFTAQSGVQIGEAGGTACVDFTVKNCTKLISAQYFVKFDNTKLTLNSITTYPTPADLPTSGMFTSVAASNMQGVVSVGYNSADPVNGLTVPDGTKFFSLCFATKAMATAGNTLAINLGDNGPSQPVEVIVASGISGQPVTPVLENGSMNVIAIVQPCNGINVAIDSTKNVKCKGQSNGAIYITASGGSGGTWSYAWNSPNGYSSTGIPDITGLKAGVYNLTATYTGCTAITKQVTLTEPDAITIPSQNVTNVKCFGGSDGSITITPAGGTAPLTYKWSGPMSFSATTQNLTGLKAGTYQVTVTDANGCTVANPIQVAQATAMSYNSGLISVANVKCFNGVDGSILLNNAVTGGTQPYTFSWSGPSYSAQTKDIGGLKAGQYTCTVTDANGCPPLVIGPIAITQPSTDLSVSISSTKDVSCFGLADGEACVTISGGTPPYTMQWAGQGPSANTACLSNRPAGTYIFTVVDANGCMKTISAVIGGPASAVTQTGISVTHVSCNGGSDGSACITATGGNPPYSYNWQPIGSATSCINNVKKGSYAVTVTDSKGCTMVASNINVDEPTAMNLSFSTNIANGCIDLTVSGGTPPYQYLWSPGGSVNQDPCGLPAGNYTVTVTDAKNCTKTGSASLISSLSITVFPGDPACSGQINGSVIINISGGSPQYTINFNTSSGTSGTVTTSNTTYELGGLKGSDIVTITVVDAQGGSASGSVQVFANPTISANISVTNANFPAFSDGAMLVEVTSGTPPYTFQWSKDGQPVTANITSGADTTKIIGQDKGLFCVTVTDAAGCSKEFCKSIIRIFPPMSLIVTTNTSPKCADGTDGGINITVNGGDGTYTFKWTLPNGTTVSTEDLSNLKEGNYTIEVKDGSGQSKTETVVVTALSHIAATAAVVSSCGNYSICTKSICNGVGVAATTGAFGAVSYLWSNGEANQTASELCAGTQCVTITDAAGCSVTECILVTAPEVIEINMPDPVANTCYGLCNGSAQVNPIGGVPPYTFKWSNGETGQIASSLCSGEQFVTVTDNFGIQQIDTFVVAGPDSMYILFDKFAPSDYETCDGIITANVIGAQLPIQYYAWNKPGFFGSTVDKGCAGEFLYVSVKDARGCIVSDTTQVGFPDNGCLVGSKVMTPANPDGKNDVLFIACADLYDNVSLEVYNRWGQLVYEAKNGYNNDWDGTYKGGPGKYLPEGTYFWILSFDSDNGRVQRKDYVTILRGNE